MCWITNPRVPCSKALGASKFESAYHPSVVDQISTKNFWELSGKKQTAFSKRVSSTLEVVEWINKKRHKLFLFMISFMDYEDKVGSEGFLKIYLIIYDNRVALRLYLILYSCRKKQLTQKRHIIFATSFILLCDLW